MSTLDNIAVVVVLLFFGCILYFIFNFFKVFLCEALNLVRKITFKTALKKRKAKEEIRSAQLEESADEKVLESQSFQYELKLLIPYFRWMTIASGRERQFMCPFVKINSEGYRFLEKRGYDLWMPNLRDYYNGICWTEREKALERFAEDLFGEYKEEMRALMSFEYIADDLIEVENIDGYDSDFVLRYQTHYKIDDRERRLFARELEENYRMKWLEK